MPVASDRDVFARFMQAGPSREIALLAFASYAEAKYDWQAHPEARDGKPPTTTDIERWIRDQSDIRLGEILKSAIAYFDEAANAYMADQIERERLDAVDQSILAEVTAIKRQVARMTSFRSMFWPNLFVGVIASFVFAVLIIAASIVYTRDPSPFAAFKTSSPATPLR